MAKKLLFTLFICFLSLFSNNLFANTPLNGENGCNTPPPDNFRFAGFGYGFVDLAWNPINPGDDHYITIYRENNNQWDSLYSIPVFNSSSYTISNLSAASRHKFWKQKVGGRLPSGIQKHANARQRPKHKQPRLSPKPSRRATRKQSTISSRRNMSTRSANLQRRQTPKPSCFRLRQRS